jgi:hypothetical protein
MNTLQILIAALLENPDFVPAPSMIPVGDAKYAIDEKELARLAEIVKSHGG